MKTAKVKTMRAVWYEKTGDSAVLQYGEVAAPVPAAGEVLVRIHASGVNPSDVKTRAGARGEMQFARQIPHSDGAGIVAQTGDGVSSARLGERVWLWNAAFGRAHGTCADFVAIPAAQAVPLHPDTSFAAGACFGVPLMTAVYGILDGDGGDGGNGGNGDKTILITGGGGAVGFYAVQAAKLSGAKVIATISGEEKKKHAMRANPDFLINYKTENVAARVLELTDGAGVDRILEVEFGGNLPVSAKIIKAGGAIVAYGSMATPEPRLPFYPLMFKNATLKMFLIYTICESARRATINAIRKMEPQLTHAVSEIVPLSQTGRAHELVESGKIIGNVVVRTGAE